VAGRLAEAAKIDARQCGSDAAEFGGVTRYSFPERGNGQGGGGALGRVTELSRRDIWAAERSQGVEMVGGCEVSRATATTASLAPPGSEDVPDKVRKREDVARATARVQGLADVHDVDDKTGMIALEREPEWARGRPARGCA